MHSLTIEYAVGGLCIRRSIY